MLGFALAFVLAGAAAGQSVGPPAAELIVQGAGPYAATLGSSCVTDGTAVGCSDTPWLTPANGPSADPAAPPEFRLADESRIAAWAASYGDAAESQPNVEHLDSA